MIHTDIKIDVLPNFLIIGAEKSGTTSLYHYLKKHPEIYLSPEKEPFFFMCEGEYEELLGNKIQEDRFLRTRIKSFDEYKNLFKDVKSQKAIGEASASYLYSTKALNGILKHIPNTKLIIILRNPIERAYSNFLHCIGRGVEPLRDFSKALDEEEKRKKENWGLVYYYKEKGFYYKYLKKYFDSFKRGNIKVIIYDDFNSNPESLLKELFNFLEVDTSFHTEISDKHNVSKKNALIDNTPTKLLKSKNPLKLFIKDFIPGSVKEKVLDLLYRFNSKPVPLMDEKTKLELIELYRDDITKLQSLINKDLSMWLK